MWNTVNNDALVKRIQTHWNVELVGKHSHLIQVTIAIRVFEYPDRITSRARGCGVWILDSRRDPNAPATIEG